MCFCIIERLSIYHRVKTYLPKFTGQGRDAITLAHLLSHTSGLRPDISLAGKTAMPSALQNASRKCLVPSPAGALFATSIFNCSEKLSITCPANDSTCFVQRKSLDR